MAFLNVFGPVSEVLFKCWDCTASSRLLILNLKKSVETLRNTMNNLVREHQDMKRKVYSAESQGDLKRSSKVVGWFKDVLAIEEEVQEILAKADLELKKKFFGGWCHSGCRCLPRYNIGKEVADKQQRLENLLEKVPQLDQELVLSVVAPPVAKRPLARELVGNEAAFEEVWRYIEDDRVRTIGLVGMGGVGKTALLTKINNEFAQWNHGYDFSVWITVSKPADLNKIQKEIWRKLKLREDEWENESDRASKILARMEEKNFLIFLDDIWERIDLSEIGVPLHNHEKKSKVIFTTRSDDIRRKMGAKLVKIRCLAPDKAFQLFQDMVGRDVLFTDPEILRLAKIMAERCKGLPLTIITVGGAMTGETNLAEWKRSIKILEQQKSRFSDIEDEVLVSLRFSYDLLPDTTQKKCFLYCALFPKDYGIDKDELIELWIGEGYLDEYGDGILDARTNGEHIIEKLVRACLLESTIPTHSVLYSVSPINTVPIIKMHDVVREMALWVSVMERMKIVCEEKLSSTMKQCRNWEGAEKLSLWDIDADESIGNWTGSILSTCSGLTTLLLRDIKLTDIPVEFFSSMLSLQVLDISKNWGLRDLPKSIGQLRNLKYLNLCGTRAKIPEELRSLTKLVVLIIDGTNMPLPKGTLSSLSSLKVFRLTKFWSSVYTADDEVNMIEELGGLTEITEVSLLLTYSTSAKKLLSSNSRLQSCLRHASMKFNDGEDPIQLNATQSSDHLVSLCLQQYAGTEIKICRGWNDIISRRYLRRLDQQDCFSFSCLRVLYLLSCSNLQDLTALMYCTPSLEILSLVKCDGMKEVMRSGENNEDNHHHQEAATTTPIFSCLTHLVLRKNKNLKSIYGSPLPFPKLETLLIFHCTELKKLPLDSNSCDEGKTLQIIYGEKEWWRGLKWDHDPNANHIFTPKFERSWL